jgi:glycosyltransferase involved in cell wall biosynthesis
MGSNTKKKIAFLGIKGLPSKAGADRVVESIISYLNKEYDISIYCSNLYSRDYKSDKFNIIKVRNLGGKYLFSFTLFILSAIHALIFKNFDLIHLHNTDAGFVIPLLRLKYRVIGTSHGYPYKREKWNNLAKNFLKFSELIFFRFSNLITCVSKSITKELKDKYKKNIYFIPNGISNPIIKEDNLIFEKFKLKYREYICFAAGRIDPTKGCHILLNAFNKIKNNIDIVAIGDFSHKKDYSETLFHMADERAKFVPFIEDKEILFGIIKKAKLFIFPSTVEAMSMMLLEVASLGVPIICSDIPENMSVLEDHTTYFQSGDDMDLAKKIEFCLEHYDEVLEMSSNARKWVIKQYNWKNISRKYKNIYYSFLKQN